MDEIMNELGDMHRVLSQSYAQLEQQHDQELSMHRETQDKHHREIVAHKEIEVAHKRSKHSTQ
jgi:hypothetical protein